MRCSKAFQTPEIIFALPRILHRPPLRRILQCERGKRKILDHTEIGGCPVHTTYISIPHDLIYFQQWVLQVIRWALHTEQGGLGG